MSSGYVISSGDTVNAPDDPTLSGNTFGGWYKEAACTNAWDFDSDTVTVDTILYAQWKAQPELSSSDSDATIYIGGRITLTPNIDGGEWDWDGDYFSATFNSLGDVYRPEGRDEHDHLYGGWCEHQL